MNKNVQKEIDRLNQLFLGTHKMLASLIALLEDQSQIELVRLVKTARNDVRFKSVLTQMAAAEREVARAEAMVDKPQQSNNIKTEGAAEVISPQPNT